MQYWCTQTCCSFSSRFASLFQGYAVTEAVKHDFLMESILALTCLHIASQQLDNPLLAAEYANAALRYQNDAVRPFHEALQNITPSNCDAVFACSIVTMACTIVSPVIPAGTEDNTKSTIESFMLLFDFVKGIASVVEISRHWLDAGPFGVMFGVRDGLCGERGASFLPPFQQLRNLNDMLTGTANGVLHGTYEHAIGKLENCFLLNKGNAVPWLGIVGKEFTDELKRKDPLALLIFVYWGVLLDSMDELWWAKYLGKRLVLELSGDLMSRGEIWEEATRWAMVEVGYQSNGVSPILASNMDSYC